MAKKQSRFLVRQKIAVAALGLLVLGILAWLAWMTVEDAPLGEFVEGEHYQLIENPRRIRPGKIEVMEFFSYGCVHCYNLEPALRKWVAQQDERIAFIPVPSVANDNWRLLGRHYYTLEQMGLLDANHRRFFREIHDARRVFGTPEHLFDHVESAGVDRSEYELAFRSPEVNAKMNRADQMARRLQIAAVPTLVIQGKYLIRTTDSVGPKRMLDVMAHLIDKELAERQDRELDASPQ